MSESQHCPLFPVVQTLNVSALLLLASTAFATGRPKGLPPPEPSVSDFLSDFVAEPHPFGSEAQKKYSQKVASQLKSFGWKTTIESFKSDTPAPDRIPSEPNLEFTKKLALDKRAFIEKLEGYNIVATRKGKENCVVILGGHYDTKPFSDFRFVGANDGGSSTALLLHVAQRFGKASDTLAQNQKPAPLPRCSVALAFFDGEEARMRDWEEGQRLLGIQDNLYGSRAFAEKIQKRGDQHQWRSLPVRLVAIFDMVGHKNQRLSLTAGSQTAAINQFLLAAQGLSVEKAEFQIEDDHTPFVKKGLPVLHVIDWTNIGEWHTRFDEPSTLSTEKIEKLSDAVMKFLSNY